MKVYKTKLRGIRSCTRYNVDGAEIVCVLPMIKFSKSERNYCIYEKARCGYYY